MTYKIAICDDNSTDSQYIASFVSLWAKKRGVYIQSDAFPSAEAFLFHYAEHKDYDILLLDIEMGGMDGVTMAKKVRPENESVQIIFITGYSEYISEGYEVSALHYLMKPVSQEKLFEVLDRAAEKLRKTERILFIHGKQNYTVKKTLSEFEAELDFPLQNPRTLPAPYTRMLPLLFWMNLRRL